MNLIRQGDLILRRIGDSETTETPKPVTLAVGEESGHSHAITAALVRPLGDSSGLIDVPALTPLHVEGMPWRHDAIDIGPGLWEFWIQRELSEADEIRQVAD